MQVYMMIVYVLRIYFVLCLREGFDAMGGTRCCNVSRPGLAIKSM